MNKIISDELVAKVFDWLGEENIRWFRHIKNLKGSVNCVLKLNFKKKHIPAHPIHLREGMQIRNFMRGQGDCIGWSAHDFDNEWENVINKCIEKLK